jgi:hypothetical protein
VTLFIFPNMAMLLLTIALTLVPTLVLAAASPVLEANSTQGLQLVDYGRYCGIWHGRDDGGIPVDILDRYCQVHDLCVGALGYLSCYCNLQLIDALDRYEPTNSEAAAEKADAILLVGLSTIGCIGYSAPFSTYAIATSYGYNYLPIYYSLEKGDGIQITALSDGIFAYETDRTENLTNELPSRLPSAMELVPGTLYDYMFSGQTLVLVNGAPGPGYIVEGKSTIVRLPRYGRYCGTDAANGGGKPVDWLDRYCQIYSFCAKARGINDCYCKEQLMYYASNYYPIGNESSEAWSWKAATVAKLLPSVAECTLWSPYQDMYMIGNRAGCWKLPFFSSMEKIAMRLGTIFNETIGYYFTNLTEGIEDEPMAPLTYLIPHVWTEVPLNNRTLVVVNMGQGDVYFGAVPTDCYEAPTTTEAATTSTEVVSTTVASTVEKLSTAEIIGIVGVSIGMLIAAVIAALLILRRWIRRRRLSPKNTVELGSVYTIAPVAQV